MKPECGRGVRVPSCRSPSQQVDDGDCPLVFVIDAVCVAPDEALSVELLVDGVPVARRDASQTDAPFAWRVELPPRVLSAGSANLTITVDEPRSPLAAGWSSDERPLGLHLRSLTLGDGRPFGAAATARRVRRRDGRRTAPGGGLVPA